MNRLALYSLAALVVVAVVAGGYLWIDSIVSENRRLASDNATLTAAVSTQKAAIESMKSGMEAMAADVKAANAALSGLHETVAGIRTDTAEAVARLQKHDLGRIANAKPRLLESRINGGHRALADSLRKASAGDQRRAEGATAER